MARRRMFSLSVCDTDAFLDMPSSAQALYFHLGLRADDDGFVSSPKRITAMVGAASDDFRILVGKGYLIPFENGVCVIRDWKQNNYIQKDRYTPTIYMAEKESLVLLPSGMYERANMEGAQVMLEQPVRLQGGSACIGVCDDNDAGKLRDKTRKFIEPTLEEVEAYCRENGYIFDAASFVDYYAANGWKIGQSKMVDWKAAVRKWIRNAKGGAHAVSPEGQGPTAEDIKNMQRLREKIGSCNNAGDK